MEIKLFKSVLFLSIVGFWMSSCATSKISKDNILFNTRWELESMSNTGSNFEQLFAQKIPFLKFNYAENTVFGNNGCNGYSAEYVIKNQSIKFGEPGPSTKMYCGEGESKFLEAMIKIDGYKIGSGGKLILMQGMEEVLVFRHSS